MRQFFLETEPDQLPAVGDLVRLGKEEEHHLSTVLRGGRETTVVLTDGRGHRFFTRIASRSRRDTSLEILSVERCAEEFAAPALVLGLAMIKPKRFEWALEKAVELGAHKIVPLISAHVDKDPAKGKAKRWRTIMISAVKQCGRAVLPELTGSRELLEFLADPPAGLTVFGAIPEEIQGGRQPVNLLDLAGHLPRAAPDHLTALVGPQGGWSEAEVQAMLEAGLQPVTLGPHILRAETAAAAVLEGLQLLRARWSDQSRGSKQP